MMTWNPAPPPKKAKTFLHMAHSYRIGFNTYGVSCRCGWRAVDLPTRAAAWSVGDAHLEEANR